MTSVQPNGYVVSNEALISYKAVLTILENSKVTKAVPSIKKTKWCPEKVNKLDVPWQSSG